MSAVTGSIVSSKDLSLSRAARMLRQFVESDTAAKPDTAAYLRRAVAAFNDLIEFHDEIERGEDENAGNEEIEEERKEKKRKGESLVRSDTEQDGGTVREVGDEDLTSEKKKKKKKKEKRKRENGDERSDIMDLSKDKIDGLDELEKEMNLESGNLGNSEVNSARKKKKRKKSEKEKEMDEN